MRILGVALLVLAVAMCPALARTEAILGSDFADAYVAFAPLESFHRSFADHLFAGTPMAIPADLASCCDGYLLALQSLQERWVTQTASENRGTLGALVRLRADAEATCAEFRADLATLGESAVVSAELEDRLVAERFFARIGNLNDRFEEALDAALLDVGEGEPRWVMSVTFAVRVLLVGSGWVRVAPDTATIFYGHADAVAPSFALPDLIPQGFAAETYSLNEQFETSLRAALGGGPCDNARRAAAMAYAVRSMLVRPSWVRISADAVATLFESAAAVASPFDVSDAVRVSMAHIVALSGTSLTEEERAAVRQAAWVIYSDFMAGN